MSGLETLEGLDTGSCCFCRTPTSFPFKRLVTSTKTPIRMLIAKLQAYLEDLIPSMGIWNDRGIH
jgi:hypothetical protein